MFSKACEYGIRAVICIWILSKDGKKIGIKKICEETDAPENFTAKVLQSLSKLGIINSSKGPNGGFYLDNNQAEIKLIDLVNAIDGAEWFVGCGLGLKECSNENPCPIHHEFKRLRENLFKMLVNKSVKDLAKEVSDGRATLKRIIK
ncbi:Rrf2 family transcriptional regulator [Echinicola marina]|uniref:Rrf2 family transcriptional regulator n=1 Tax=Echinicola rosea TaxID=1807691 RepID=A0ABQ1VAZ8_9BACT|nr:MULTISPECIES: Rrf2 family transcriptional regulator [Echinicola]UCS93305.1 Rrf2 family transcriptional regulator [Echinicola marina]GGF50437.1 hypothetical protein GCM10011339_43760 [Echinicola rosea]